MFDDISEHLGTVAGGTRQATSPSANHQDRAMRDIERELAGMSSGGDDMMMMLLMMKMMSGGGDQPTEVHSPGLIGSLIGGTTKIK